MNIPFWSALRWGISLWCSRGSGDWLDLSPGCRRVTLLVGAVVVDDRRCATLALLVLLSGSCSWVGVVVVCFTLGTGLRTWYVIFELYRGSARLILRYNLISGHHRMTFL